jgi:hypothetical protein
MLASITPLGERSRRQSWGITVTALTVGAVFGGAAIGALAALLGQLAHPAADIRPVALAAVVVLLVAAEVATDRVSPHLRQVNEEWLHRYRGWVYGAGFGVQLGTGLATTVTTTAVYATLAACLLAPTVAVGTVIGLVFGALRGLSSLATGRVRTPGQLAAFHRRFVALDRPGRLAGLAVQAGAALAVLGVLL